MEINETWEEFKERIFGTPYMIWHDGVGDYSHELSREGPEHVRRMLLEGLRNEDYVAAEALTQVDLPDLIPDLIQRLPKTTGKFKIELATMLQEKAPPPDDRYAKIVIHELLYPTWIMRMDSAILLRNFPAEYVNETLLDRVANDPDYYVRYHSADSYLKVNNLRPNGILDCDDIFPLICTPSEQKIETTEDYERHKKAAEMLKALKTEQAYFIVAPNLEL